MSTKTHTTVVVLIPLEVLARDWQPISFTASAVSLIWRGEPPDDVFRVANTIALGSRSS